MHMWRNCKIEALRQNTRHDFFKEKILEQTLSTDLNLHRKVNTMHASLPKYIYEGVSPEGPLKRQP